jgi:hypothetical protein
MLYLFRFQTLMKILFIVAEAVNRLAIIVFFARKGRIKGILNILFSLRDVKRGGEFGPPLQSLLEAISLKIW